MKDTAALPQPVASRRCGHGPRPVLAIHCTIAHAGAWRGVARLMEEETTLTAFDMLSHGRSPDWDESGDFQDRITEIGADFLTGRMDVVGHSFGATVALRLAVAYPERIRSLTLIEPVYFAVARQDAPQLVADHDADARDYIAALAARNDALGARLFNRMWSDGGPRWPDLPEATRAAMLQQLNAERARRAQVTEAEGRKRAVELAADGDLYAAEQQAKAKRVLADAEAYATNAIAVAIREGGIEAAQYQVAMRQVDVLTEVGQGQGKQTIVLPASAIEVFGDAFKLFKGAKSGGL